ncbi:MAG: hypothetical protein U1E76_26610 [Planctomycetota bacterium]
MQQNHSPSNQVAFEARAIARLLATDRVFMEMYKTAAREDRFKAVSSGGRNYVVVLDAAIEQQIQELVANIATYRHDAATGSVQRA